MALGGFNINSVGPWVAPSSGIGPDSSAPAIVTYPEPVAASISGQPCMGIGSPYARVGRRYITSDGLLWYMAFLGGLETGNAVQVCLYDPLRASWALYQAIMHRPIVTASRPGTVVTYSGFSVLFSDLVFTGLDT